MSKPSATVNDLVTADVATYGGKDAPAMGAQWAPVPIETILKNNHDLAAEMTKVGFYGQVYVNQHTGEVIIANRGTDNKLNVGTDGEVALELPPNARPVANDFARAGLKAAQEQLADAGVKMSALYTTGHSLGGAEAEGQAAMLSRARSPDGTLLVPMDVHITNLSIDAPGIAEFAHRGDPRRYTSYNLSSRGDVVHLAGGDQLTGTVEVSLPIGPSMVETAGYMALGAATLNGVIEAKGLSNALAAHRSTLVLSHVSGSQLGDMKVTELGMSEEKILNAFAARSAKTEDVATRERHLTHVADDLMHTDASHMQIWGIDKRGNVDPAALESVAHGAHGAYAEQWLDQNDYQCHARVQPKNI